MIRESFRPWIACALFLILVSLGIPLRAQTVTAPPPPSPLPLALDGDGDGSSNRLEAALGSNPGDRASQPESHALLDGDRNGVADACENSSDDDRDGAVDLDDPGCTPPPLETDLEPGLDVFQTQAKIEAGALGPNMPRQSVELSGPAVVRRGVAKGGVMPVAMEAMQLSGRMGDVPVTLVTNPALPSRGTVSSSDGQPPWTSRFEVNTQLVAGGQVMTHPAITLENPSLSHLPPVQDSRKIDPSKCYRWTGGLHCPEVPVLRIPVLKWAAKFDCGEQPSTPPPFLGSVKPGDYATKIVIHNPQGVPVLVKKKVSVGERNPKTGPISPFKTVTLPPDGTTEVDCPDVFNLLGMPIPEKKPLPFINGVVVLISEKKLDVIANYTQEVPKEKVDFILQSCPAGAPPALRGLIGRRLKVVTLVTEDTVVDEEREVRRILSHYYPPQQIKSCVIKILSDSVGVGAGIDVEEVRPQRCILVDPPELPDGKLECDPPL